MNAFPKIIMDLNKICRLCSTEKRRLKSIFHNSAYKQLQEVIVDVLRLDIRPEDGLPPNICKLCANILTKLKEYVEQFRENDKILRQKIECAGIQAEKVEDDSNSNINSNESATFKQESLDQKYDHESDLINDVDNVVPTADCIRSDTEEYDQPKRKVRKKSTDCSKALPKIKQKQSRRSTIDNADRPKLNDHKCYICRSESMGSAKALLEHLSTHLDLMPYTCTDCVMETVVLKNVRSLNVHKKMHAQPIKCEYCDRRYSDYWARDGHVNTYHLGESAPCLSTCEQCGKVCKSIAALKSHMRDHKLDVKCDQCGKVFHRLSKLREHVTRVHEKAEKYECKICHQVVHSLESYNSHLKMHNSEKTYNCDLCSMKFYTAGNLGLHKRVHAKNANYKPHKDWTSHYKIEQDAERGKIYTCNHCGNTYSGTINAIISHVKHHFKDVQCDRCELKFTNLHKLKIHYVVHTRERNYRCEHCGKDFLYRTHMNYHIKHKHSGAVAETSEPETVKE